MDHRHWPSAFDPAGDDLMRQQPRPVGECVVTLQTWRGIAFVGTIMAAGTLFAFDVSLPGGFVDGAYAQTMAFTTLMLFQIFNVINARSDETSAFVGLLRVTAQLWRLEMRRGPLQATSRTSSPRQSSTRTRRRRANLARLSWPDKDRPNM